MHLLLNGEFNFLTVDCAVLIVNMDKTTNHLIRQENVLLELRPHLGGSLVHAAARRNLTSLSLLLSCLELYGWFSNDQLLLVLHLVVIIERMHFGLDRVLDLGLRLLANVLVLIHVGRWDTSWH